MTELISLPYSPWSDKAKWALSVRHVPFEARTWSPIVGELGLRRRLGRWRGKVTVPVLVSDDGVLGDSLDIARWADARGEGPVLFPPGVDIEPYNALSERGLAAGRALSLLRAVADPEAMAELVPGRLRRRLGPLAGTVGTLGVRRTLRKYGCRDRTEDEHRAELREVLTAIRAALAASPSTATPRTVLATFSYADIALSQVLSYVVPPPTLRLGPRNRAAFHDPTLGAEFGDLVAWRDALYAAWR